MDEGADIKKTALHGSPRPEPDEKPLRPSPPTMQSALSHPQHHQHQQQQQQQQPQHRQQQYYGPPSAQQLPSPDHRGSPPGAAAMSLPSIQHFEGAGLQSQPQYVPAAHMNGVPPMMHAPLPYNHNMVSYQPPPMPPTMPSNAPNGHGGMMRFPLPPQAPMDPGHMSAGRHKKEIKRRTKTGCLTCRKRRIKCDEEHPTCRNCIKSKRECLGYDPIFKQQPTQTPASIQPAPVSSAPPSKPSPIISTIPSASYPPYHATGGTYPHQLSHHAASLEGPTPYHVSTEPSLAEHEPNGVGVTTNTYNPIIQAARRHVKLTIDELFNLNDIQPQLPVRSTLDQASPETQQELEALYNYKYAHALDKLFETSWYSNRGFATLNRDPMLREFAVQCMEEMRSKSGPYGQTAPMPSLASLEARLVWSLAVLPRKQHMYNANEQSSDSTLLELLPRVDTVESLLTGRYLETSRSPSPPPSVVDNSSGQSLKSNHQAFWYHLGRFASLRDDQGDVHTLDQVATELANMRMILDVLENRDVLYSIAVARHIGGRMPDWSPQHPLSPVSNDPNDDVNKLNVACRFVQSEDQSGTSQVIQRICSMSLRAWNLQRHQQ